MNIAYIGQKGIPASFGGVETHVANLSDAMVKQGNSVTVYARSWYTESEDGYTNEGVYVKHMPSIRTKHLDTITHTFFATIDAITHNYDVIHYHGVGPALLSFLPRIFAKDVKVVTTFHSIDRKHAKWGFFAKMALMLGEWATGAFAHETIAVSRTITQYLRDVFDVQATYIPNGVPMPKKEHSVNVLKEFGLAPQKYFLSVTRLVRHKGVHYTIEAYKKWKEQTGSSMPLVIVGDGHFTDDYVQELQELAGDDEQIIFTGFQSGKALAALYTNATAFIHASEQEGLPISVLEAMSYGLPIAVSDIPEHKELISDATYHFRYADEGSIVAAFTTLMNLSETEKQAIEKAYRAFVASAFNWQTIAAQITQVYEKTIKPSAFSWKTMKKSFNI